MHKLSRTDSVEIVFIGHPGDSPNDLRAQCLIVCWKEGGMLTSSDQDRFAAKGKIVLRATYYCQGVCSLEDKLVNSAQSM